MYFFRSVDEELHNKTCDNLEPDFENPTNLVEINETEEDYEEIPEKWEMMEKSEKMEPGKEEIEIINLGSEEDRKEVKVGTTVALVEKEG